MFPCMIARAATIDMMSTGMGGTRNGALQLVSSLFETDLKE
jgi:homeobox-leucine zipper protein